MTAPDITIPPEALEAAAIDLHRLVYEEPDSYSWAETDEEMRTHFRKIARAACLAMLQNWEGRKTENRDGWNWTDAGAVTTHRYEALILPLPKEPTDDK